MKPLIKTIERRNGKEVVIYRPNPRYPKEKALKEFTELLNKIVSRGKVS